MLAHRADRFSERDQLRAALIVAREQDHAAGHRMGKAAFVVVSQRFADHVEHHRSGSGFHRIPLEKSVGQKITRPGWAAVNLFLYPAYPAVADGSGTPGAPACVVSATTNDTA